MKKPSSLAEQISQAQRTVETWTDTQKANLRVEGYDVFLNRNSIKNLSGDFKTQKELVSDH